MSISHLHFVFAHEGINTTSEIHRTLLRNPVIIFSTYFHKQGSQTRATVNRGRLAVSLRPAAAPLPPPPSVPLPVTPALAPDSERPSKGAEGKGGVWARGQLRREGVSARGGGRAKGTVKRGQGEGKERRKSGGVSLGLG